MAKQQRAGTFDVNLQFSGGESAITASAAAQVGGSAQILDLGAGRVDAVAVLDVSAIDVSSGDEKYQLELQFSSSSSFASVGFIGPVLILGDSTVAFTTADSTTGRYEVPFCNEQNGTRYRYARLFRRLSGTTPSITSTAYVWKVGQA